MSLLEWEVFTGQFKTKNFFQTSEMMNIYDKTKNQKGDILLIRNSSGEIVAGMQVGIVWQSGAASWSKRAIVKGGPFWVEEGALEALMSYYEKYAKDNGLLYTEIRNVYLQEQIPGYKFIPELNYILDLKKGWHELLQSFSKARRYGINRAIKNGLIFKEIPAEQVKEFYNILQATYKKAQLPLADISFFEALHKSPSIKFFGVYNKEKLIGGMVAVTWDNIIYDWYAACTDLELYPNDFLYWKVIDWACAQDYETFDFGGAGFPEIEYGPREFKKQFNGEAINYGRFMKIHKPVKYKLAMLAFKLLRRFL